MLPDFVSPLQMAAWIVVLITVGILVAVWLSAKKGSGKDPMESWRRNSRRWATQKQIQDMLIADYPPDPQDVSGRVYVGRFRKWQLYGPRFWSVMVMAPAGSGKTGGVVVPDVISHQGPAIVASVKSDVYELTVAPRSNMTGARVQAFDPTGSVPGLESGAWSPLLGISTYADAQRVAKSVTDASKAGQSEGMRGQEFWDHWAVTLVSPLLWTAVKGGYSMGDVADWAKLLALDEKAVEARVAESESASAMNDWFAFRHMGAKETKSSVVATAIKVLGVWGNDAIRSSVDVRINSASIPYTPDNRPIIDIDALLDSEHDTLYLVSPMSIQGEYTPVFESLVNEVLRRVEERVSARSGKALEHPLFVCIDEAANVAPLRRLDNIVSTVRAQGVMMMTVWQDEGQVVNMYGRDRARTVMSNHLVQVYLPGAMQDQETLKMISEAIGQDTYEDVSYSHSESGNSRTVTPRLVDVAPVWWLKSLPVREAVILASSHPAIRASFPGYWEVPQLRDVMDPEILGGFATQFKQTMTAHKRRRKRHGRP